ncbi:MULTISPECIES: hypothetical protein [Cellulophaga]|uniref:Uncharacterized protein n=1 Tax=Cellulophaga algicola (strain DSM 14237 / IC166 / ACAM 630) TaxID=688270 RepID=E6X7C3_CELAD|nr:MULTISPECIES: hypothetical protein [Cellulophaga]ADV48576.1 hypothetical protein Celal_1261 [Cellulophaga algicola DSM 14237]
MNFIYSNTKETGVDKKQVLRLMLLDIINAEKELNNKLRTWQQIDS